MLESTERDLPLMANSNQIMVWHYLLDLRCDLEACCLEGSITLFLVPVPPQQRVFSVQEYQKLLQQYQQSESTTETKVPEHAALSVKSGACSCHHENLTDTKSLNNPSASQDDLKQCSSVAEKNGLHHTSDPFLIKGNQPYIDKMEILAPEKINTLPETIAYLKQPENGEINAVSDVCEFQKRDSIKNEGIVDSNTEKGINDGLPDSDRYSKDSQNYYTEYEKSNTTSSPVSNTVEVTSLTGSVSCSKDLSDVITCDQTPGDAASFCVILDAYCLDVEAVEEVLLPQKEDEELQQFCGAGCHHLKQTLVNCSRCPGQELKHEVEKWCIRISKPNVTEPQDFPSVIRIKYKTRHDGCSLRWTVDQAGRPCMFSAAMWVNNRGMFPGMEFGCLSTWQAFISPPEGATVIMSGDQNEQVTQLSTGGSTFYYECNTALPCFTLALAVGYWQHTEISSGVQNTDSAARQPTMTCQHDPQCWVTYSSQSVLPCRVWAPDTILPRAVAEFKDYFSNCSTAVADLLGAHPHQRVDILIYPPCSQDMALSNPSLLFLSQSLLAGDGSMRIRLGHELSHWWFGLLIGAHDWTEEWLSEGFATFVEDSIHARAMKWCEKTQRDHSELRALLRLRTLQAELENTNENIQTLRPNQGAALDDTGKTPMCVKNGLNPEKLFTQVHYLKGYFLLRHLSAIVGTKAFEQALQEHIIKHHGQLIYSKDFLQFILEKFPESSKNASSVDQFFAEWLDCPGMPKNLQNFSPSPDNSLCSGVLQELDRWKSWNKIVCRKNSARKRRKFDIPYQQMEADQLVLLLEYLLEEPKVAASVLTKLRTHHKLDMANADVRHRWCELVVKHKCSAFYGDVQKFLINDQAMGVYLYGEMILSRCPAQRTLAERCFAETGPHMEQGTNALVHSMIFGTAPE